MLRAHILKNAHKRIRSYHIFSKFRFASALNVWRLQSHPATNGHFQLLRAIGSDSHRLSEFEGHFHGIKTRNVKSQTPRNEFDTPTLKSAICNRFSPKYFTPGIGFVLDALTPQCIIWTSDD